MKWSAVPQPVAVRLLDLDERVTDLLGKADKAAAEVENARAIINGQHDVGREVFKQVRETFDALYASALSTRQRAENERGILADIRTWIERLPHNSRLLVVSPAASDTDLSTSEAKLQALRLELHRLNAITLPSDDIGERVNSYVCSLAAKAQPLLRGYGDGQSLNVSWPTGPDVNRVNGNGFSNIDGNALMFFALLQPAALTNAIMRSVAATLPMPKQEIAKRRAELPNEIDELSYVVAALRDKAGAPPDPSMAPWHILGVRMTENENEEELV